MPKAVRTAIYCLPLLIAALLIPAILPGPIKAQAAPILRNLASILFLTAGALRLATWRLTRDWATARTAIVLFIVGTALPATSVLGLLVHDGRAVSYEAPETRLLFVFPLLAIVLIGARHSPRLMRRTLAALIGVTAALPILVLAYAHGTPPDERYLPLWLITEACTAAVWTALLLQTLSRRRQTDGAISGWTPVGPALMVAAEAFKAWSLTDPTAVHGIATYLQVLAGGVGAMVAASGLLQAIHNGDSASADISRALVDTERRLIEIEQLQRERLHDARSAVLGVVGASELLTNPARMLAVDPRTLRSLVAEELHRLEGLLDVNDDEPVIEFDLASALASVVLARRLDGMTVDLAWRGSRVVGRPRATATAIDNLLRNAARHAPGARVLLSARNCVESVEIVVSDDGPGIPAAERDHVVRPGARGSRARGEGSGLGLYSAAKAMAAQSGSLEIGESPCGGTKIVLRLPAPAPLHAVAS